MDPKERKERELYVELCCKEILAQKGVENVIVMNEDCEWEVIFFSFISGIDHSIKLFQGIP